MDVILALDPGKRTGVALGVPGARPVLSVVNFARTHDGPEDIFACTLETDKPTLLAIEAPIPPSQKAGLTNFDTTLIAIGLSAIFRGAARERSIPIKLAPIGSWRKYVLGCGNLKGADAKAGMVRLCRGLGWGDVDHNAAEAAGIWLYACALTAPKMVCRHEPLFSGAAV